MNSKIDYLSIDDVIKAHRITLTKLGFVNPQLRSHEQLEGALERVRNAARYDKAPLIRQAAILAVSVSQAQAFLDGNKRAGVASMMVFLKRNGLRFTAKNLQVALFLEVNAYLSMVRGYEDEPTRIGIDAFCLWLESVVTSL